MSLSGTIINKRMNFFFCIQMDAYLKCGGTCFYYRYFSNIIYNRCSISDKNFIDKCIMKVFFQAKFYLLTFSVHKRIFFLSLPGSRTEGVRLSSFGWSRPLTPQVCGGGGGPTLPPVSHLLLDWLPTPKVPAKN